MIRSDANIRSPEVEEVPLPCPDMPESPEPELATVLKTGLGKRP